MNEQMFNVTMQRNIAHLRALLLNDTFAELCPTVNKNNVRRTSAEPVPLRHECRAVSHDDEQEQRVSTAGSATPRMPSCVPRR